MTTMTTMTVSPAKLEQRAVALALANRVRMDIADWKRDVKNMSREDAIEEVRQSLTGNYPPTVARLKLGHMLDCVRSLGEVKVDRILLMSGVRADRHLGDLTDRQRQCVADALNRLT